MVVNQLLQIFQSASDAIELLESDYGSFPVGDIHLTRTGRIGSGLGNRLVHERHSADLDAISQTKMAHHAACAT